jgi:hypothetical protein
MGQEREGSARLARLITAVTKWRENGGGRGTTMPVALWNQAVRVARVDGIWRTAKETRLEYAQLKERMAGTKRRKARRRRARREDAFVEVSAAQLLGAPATGTLVEVEDKTGTRMSVRLGSVGVDEVAQLIAVFRQRGA